MCTPIRDQTDNLCMYTDQELNPLDLPEVNKLEVSFK